MLIIHVVDRVLRITTAIFRSCTASERQVFWVTASDVHTHILYTSSNRPAVVVRTYPKSFRPYTKISVCSGVLFEWKISRPSQILYKVLSGGFSFESSYFLSFRGLHVIIIIIHERYYTHHHSSDLTIGMRRKCTAYTLYDTFYRETWNILILDPPP